MARRRALGYAWQAMNCLERSVSAIPEDVQAALHAWQLRQRRWDAWASMRTPTPPPWPMRPAPLLQLIGRPRSRVEGAAGAAQVSPFSTSSSDDGRADARAALQAEEARKAGSICHTAAGARGLAQVDPAATSPSAAASSGGDGDRTPGPVPPRSWLDDALPAAAVPYAQLMRLDKPIGTWLLLWPGLWAVALAAPAGSPPDLWTSGLFAMGAVVSASRARAAMCTPPSRAAVWRRVEVNSHAPLGLPA